MTNNSHPSNGKACGSVLLIIDMISDFEFEDGAKLFPRSLKVAENIAALKRRSKQSGIPVIYVNDAIDGGSMEPGEDIRSLEKRSSKAAEMLSILAPEDDDHLIIKPQRSGFYGTSLGNLLLSLNASTVVATGVTTDICVFFTVHDAYMRGYSVSVPSNCCTAVEDSHHREALRFLNRVTEARTDPFLAEPRTRSAESLPMMFRPEALTAMVLS